MKTIDLFKNPLHNIKTKTDKLKSESNVQRFDARIYKVDADEQNVYIDLTKYSDNEKVPFYRRGYDVYPQILNQLYIMGSPVHSSCINLKSIEIIGGGYSWKGIESLSLIDQKNIMKFEAKNDLSNLVVKLTTDYVIHNRATVFITICKDKVKYDYVNPAKIRYNKHKTIAYFNDDHQSSLANDKTFPIFNGQTEDGKYLLNFDGYTPGLDIYTVPDYNSGIKYININSKIPNWYIADMENSVNPNLVIRVPTPLSDNPQLKQAWINMINSQKGVDNNGNTLLFDGPGFENVAEIQQLNTNDNDKRFGALNKDVLEQICYAHRINPSILGFKTPGSLGMNQEMLTAYEQFRLSYVYPTRLKIEKMINTLVTYSEDIVCKVEINDFQTINTTILDKK